MLQPFGSSLNAGINIRQYPFKVKGDGVTNYTTQLINALTKVGARVFIPAGTYIISQNLVPTCAEIICEGEDSVIFKPTISVTKCLSLGTLTTSPKKIQGGLTIDGVNTVSATGIKFGDAAPWTGEASNITVKNFTGAGAVGVWYGDMYKSHVHRITSTNNDTNWVTSGNAGYPSDTTSVACSSKSAVTKGFKVISGYNLKFIEMPFENNTQEGLILLPVLAGTIQEVNFDEARFTGNYGANTAQYQVVAGDGTSMGGAKIRFSMRNPSFTITGATARAVSLNGSIVDANIENPKFSSVIADPISVTNDASMNVIPYGQCRFDLTSTVLATLSRKGGNKLTIGGITYTIPAAGVTISNAALAASTLYYVYAFINAGSITLELSTTAYTQNNIYGVPTKTGDNTRTLVGMIHTDAGSLFDLALSWFNKKIINSLKQFTADRTTGSNTYIELNTEIRSNFLVWAGDIVQVSSEGTNYTDNASRGLGTAAVFDSTIGSEPGLDTTYLNSGVTTPMAFAFSGSKSGLAEGYHFITLVGKFNGGAGTGTWTGTIGNNQSKCSLHICNSSGG